MSDLGFNDFGVGLTHQDFYNTLDQREREQYHLGIASTLETILKTQEYPKRELLVALAYHCDMGGQVVKAAKYRLQAAKVFYSQDQFDKTKLLCYDLLTLINTLEDDSVECDRLYTEAIHFLMHAHEAGLKMNPQDNDLPLDDLLEKAEVAAQRTGDQELIMMTKVIRGKMTVLTKGLTDGVNVLREAFDSAQEANCLTASFFIISDLGFYSVGQDVAHGLEMMLRAHNLYERELQEMHSGLDRLNMERSFHRLKSRIGVVLFDKGDYGEAMRWLEESYHLLNGGAPGPQFLAQVYIMCGMFEEAERVLKAALEDLFDKRQLMSIHDLYTLSELGKLYIEWGRCDDAADPIEFSWLQTEKSGVSWLVTLVGTYRAELLLAEGYSGYDPVAAEKQARLVLEVAEAAGWHRTIVNGLFLTGKALLAQGRHDEALTYAEEAAQYLQRMVDLPAVRKEEVLYQYALALKAVGRDDEAQDALEHAHDILAFKVGSLRGEDQRAAMRERVPVSRAILAAVNEKI